MRRRAMVIAAVVVVAAAVAACAPARPTAPISRRPAPTVITTSQETLEQAPGPARHASKLPPVIFYSPHPDDESIGMGQAIRRALRSGRPVYVVLLTDGEASHSYERYYLRHPELWRDGDGDGDHGKSRADFGMARRREFTRAVTDLGVPSNHVAFYGAAGREIRTGLTRDYFPAAKVMAIMRGYEKRFPGALQVTVMKYTDGDPHGPGDAMPQQEHRAACEALRRLVALDHIHAEFYKVYVYDLPVLERWAPHIEDDPLDHPAKVNALEDGYARVASTPDHLGIGWASVTLNMRNDLVDTQEYCTDASDFR